MRAFGAALLAASVLATGARGAEGVSDAALVKAARATPLVAIDLYADKRRACGDTRSVEQWLRDVVGPTAKSIRWAGGTCTLTGPANTRDAGTRWCARADITPKAGNRTAAIEVFFEKPRAGRPGKAFAFRSLTRLKNDANYGRSPGEFASDWGATHVKGYKAPESDSCDD